MSSARTPSSSGTRTPTSRAPTRSCCRAGFRYGDYLRTGAIARFSPIMRAVRAFADRGGPVLGICNGFQILLEAGLLPGAMLRNRSVKFLCQQVHVRVEQIDTPFTCACRKGQVLQMPIAHGDGNYFAEPDVIARLEANRQVVFRYTNAAGEVTDEANPNGSAAAIGGLCNEARNVVGLMPHPERACESVLGSADGLVVLESVVAVAQVGSAGGARMIDRTGARASRPERGRVRPHPQIHGPRAEPDRARHLLGDVVRALQLQELARASENAADRGTAGAAGTRRKRGRRGHRRRPRGRLQDRVAQSPVVHRAVPGRRHRRRAASSATSSRWARGRLPC